MLNKALLLGLCLFSAFKGSSQVSDTLQLHINEHNTIFVKGVLNKKDTLTLNFDTGCTDLIITNDVLKNKLRDSIQLYRTNYPFQLGKAFFNTKVYDAVLTGHGTEGRFGWNFFADKTVELNYDKGIMVIHEQLPLSVLNDKTYTKLPIKIISSVPFIEAEIIQDNVSLKDNFLFDTGYQRTAMLDNEELEKNKFPTDKMKELKRVMMKGAMGNEVPVITSELQTLKIGDLELQNVPVQQIVGSKPMRNHSAHILGNEVLKRFNVFMDYKNGYVYLKFNSLEKVAYIEAKKA